MDGMTRVLRFLGFFLVLTVLISLSKADSSVSNDRHEEEEEKKFNVLSGNESLKSSSNSFLPSSSFEDDGDFTSGVVWMAGPNITDHGRLPGSGSSNSTNDSSPENHIDSHSGLPPQQFGRDESGIFPDSITEPTSLGNEHSIRFNPFFRNESVFGTTEDDSSTTDNQNCTSENKMCEFVFAEEGRRHSGEATGRAITLTPLSAITTQPLWNVVKFVKPVPTDHRDSLESYTFQKISPSSVMFRPEGSDTNTTAQTSENVIPVEVSVVGKNDSVIQSLPGKSEKTKSLRQDHTHMDVHTDDRVVKTHFKVISPTPLIGGAKHSTTPLPDITLWTSPFFTRPLFSMSWDTTLPFDITSVRKLSTPDDGLEDFFSTTTPYFSFKFSKVSPKEIPTSDYFSTLSWYNAKSNIFQSDSDATKNAGTIPSLYSSIVEPSSVMSETVTEVRSSVLEVPTVVSSVSKESAVVPPFSDVSTVLSSVSEVPVVPLVPEVSTVVSSVPEISTVESSVPEVSTLESSVVLKSLTTSYTSEVPQLNSPHIIKDWTESPTDIENAPPPRLTNPGCSSLPICVEVTLLDTTWDEFCPQTHDFREFLAKAVSHYTRPVHAHQIVLDMARCGPQVAAHVALSFYVTDDSGEYEERLTEICGLVLKKWAPTAFRNSLMEIKMSNSEPLATPLPILPELNSGFVAAVSISAVAGVALCLLCILLVIMKQKLLQNRQSETPPVAAADAYSLDSLSINASFRRRRTRRSARSYLNHAFSDQEIPSHPLNEKTLQNCLKNRELLEEEFKRIPMIMPKLDQIPEGAHVKNRYSNILPRPETRVVLADPSGDPLKCYINANFIKGYAGKASSYVACQAPLPDGIEDFWRMVWEQQCRVIIMLTMFEENGIARCVSYFPQSSLVSNPPYGDFQVSLLKKDVYEFYTMSTLRLLDIDKNLFRDIVHLWFTNWPDVGVPKDPANLVTFVQQCRSYIDCNSGPTVVHCSTGTGRTGVFLAIDICSREFDESHSMDILRCVSQLRRDRAGAVQNKDQYILIHEAMLEYVSRVSNQSHRPSIRSNI